MSTKHETTEPRVNLELALSHQGQIRALTEPGLSDEERVQQFMNEAEFDPASRWYALEQYREGGYSPAKLLWYWGSPQKSLFAYMPGCQCPVIEAEDGRELPGIPTLPLPDNWRPDRSTLEAFARVQMEHRA